MTETIVEAEGVVKRFGKVEALAGLGLVARTGQVTAVLGSTSAPAWSERPACCCSDGITLVFAPLAAALYRRCS